MFSRGKEVISFPPFVCVWMRATLFQQYSLVSTPLSILTKIYNLSLPYNSRWSQKNRNFLNWCNSPHQISAGFFLLASADSCLSVRLPVEWWQDERKHKKVDVNKITAMLNGRLLKPCWCLTFQNMKNVLAFSGGSWMLINKAYWWVYLCILGPFGALPQPKHKVRLGVEVHLVSFGHYWLKYNSGQCNLENSLVQNY